MISPNGTLRYFRFFTSGVAFSARISRDPEFSGNRKADDTCSSVFREVVGGGGLDGGGVGGF